MLGLSILKLNANAFYKSLLLSFIYHCMCLGGKLKTFENSGVYVPKKVHRKRVFFLKKDQFS